MAQNKHIASELAPAVNHSKKQTKDISFVPICTIRSPMRTESIQKDLEADASLALHEISNGDSSGRVKWPFVTGKRTPL
jgi:hypothetical protein